MVIRSPNKDIKVIQSANKMMRLSGTVMEFKYKRMALGARS